MTANAAKLALIRSWFHKTAVAHNIKDLEKALPSVASINGMQVKDYLQALSDENQIRVEKIGSGNWYWSFPSDEQKAKQAALEKAQEEYNKAAAVVTDLQGKVDEAGAAREDDDELLMGSGTTHSHQCLEIGHSSHIGRRGPQNSYNPTCRYNERTRGPPHGTGCLQ